MIVMKSKNYIEFHVAQEGLEGEKWRHNEEGLDIHLLFPLYG